jgi:hypothetical protein
VNEERCTIVQADSSRLLTAEALMSFSEQSYVWCVVGRVATGFLLSRLNFLCQYYFTDAPYSFSYHLGDGDQQCLARNKFSCTGVKSNIFYCNIYFLFDKWLTFPNGHELKFPVMKLEPREFTPCQPAAHRKRQHSRRKYRQLLVAVSIMTEDKSLQVLSNMSWKVNKPVKPRNIKPVKQ